jgi:hypothetical protein
MPAQIFREGMGVMDSGLRAVRGPGMTLRVT